MPGNTPNISDDTFNFIKAYAKVILQQGVPILDSDWNELQDIIRMARIRQNISALGNCRLAPGSSSNIPGFVLRGNGSVNNFYFTPGLACVEGVIVPSEHGVAEPSSDVWYDGNDNYMMEGTVTTVGSGRITDEHTVYELFMDVVGCRIRMTSGAELGSTFIISDRYSATKLQLAGGTGSIAPGDTYKMLPPPLTTPVSPRNDEVYLQVWFDDINAEEDTDLLNLALGMEPSHRDKLRSVVRVAEGGVTPTTPDPYSLGVRYMKLGVLERTSSSSIASGQVETSPNAVLKAGKGSADIISQYPQLLWRNLGFRSDPEVDITTISLYQYGPALIVLRGVYIGTDGHIYMGTQTTYGFYADTKGSIRFTNSGSPGADLGAYDSESTFYCISDFKFTGPVFKGGTSVKIHSQLDMLEGADMQLSDDGHILGDSSVSSNAMKLFEVNAGFESRVLYTDEEIWWLINTSYNRSTQEFTSIVSPYASQRLRFARGIIQFSSHPYSATPWSGSAWVSDVVVELTRVHSKDFVFTRDMASFSIDQAVSYSRYPGFLCVRLEHPTQGKHVALFRTEDNDATHEMISGNATYFSSTQDNSGTVNIYPSGSSEFFIQNKLTVSADIGYGYIQLWDM
jgi:hypothetical protein